MKTLFAIILIIILLEATILLGMVVYDEIEVRRIIKHKTDRKDEPYEYEIKALHKDYVEPYVKIEDEPQTEREGE